MNKKIYRNGSPQYFYQNELDKPCFQNDMAYGEFKDVPLKNGF